MVIRKPLGTLLFFFRASLNFCSSLSELATSTLQGFDPCHGIIFSRILAPPSEERRQPKPFFRRKSSFEDSKEPVKINFALRFFHKQSRRTTPFFKERRGSRIEDVVAPPRTEGFSQKRIRSFPRWPIHLTDLMILSKFSRIGVKFTDSLEKSARALFSFAGPMKTTNGTIPTRSRCLGSLALTDSGSGNQLRSLRRLERNTRNGSCAWSERRLARDASEQENKEKEPRTQGSIKNSLDQPRPPSKGI
jgi:hypothetical protein